MKILLSLIVVLFSPSLATDILDVNSLGIKNLEFEWDREWVQEFMDEYESRPNNEIIAVINDYADQLFENIAVFAVENNLDPLNLTDVEDDFLASSITLKNGQLTGISTIERYDDVTVSYSTDTKVLEVHLPIEFTGLNFTYDYHVIILLIGPEGIMLGKVKEFKMSVKLQFDFNTYHASVLKVHTSNKGHVSVTFKGNGIVDIVANILSEFTTAILQPMIGLIVEGVVNDVANLVVDTVNNAIDSIFFPTSSTVASTVTDSYV